MRRLLPLVLLSAVLLAGCAAAPASSSGGGAGDSAESGGDPAELVGLWRVDAASVDEPSWLRVDATEATLWRQCGVGYVSWRALGSQLLLGYQGGSADCDAAMTGPGWLDAVTGWQREGDGIRLLGDEGTTVAVLTPDDTLPESRDALAPDPVVPRLTDEDRSRLSASPEPPAAGTPATDLVGRWVVAGTGADQEPHVEFSADGTWTGSDGCNGGQGRWLLGVDGALLATSGVSTLIACDGAAVPAWVAAAVHATVDGDRLTLWDQAGNRLGALVDVGA